MSEFIKKLKESQRNVRVGEQVDAYDRCLGQIILAKRRNDMDSVLTHSLKSLEFLEAMIKDTKKYSPSFDITTVPTLEEGFFIAVVKGLRDQIENFKEVVSYYSELEPLKIKFETIEKVVDYIKTNSGCLQEDLKKIYPDIDPSLLYKFAFGMEACGLIKRERAGNTFRLVYQDGAQPTKDQIPSGTDITVPVTQKPKVSTKWLAHSIKIANPPVILLPFRLFREDKYQSQEKDKYWQTFNEAGGYYSKGEYEKAKREFLKIYDAGHRFTDYDMGLLRTYRKILATLTGKSNLKKAVEIYDEMFSKCPGYTNTDIRNYNKVIEKLVVENSEYVTKKKPLIDDNTQDVFIDSKIVRFLACVRRPTSLKASSPPYNASSTNVLSLIELSEFLPRELPHLKFDSRRIEYNTDRQIPFLPHTIDRHKSLLNGKAFVVSATGQKVYIYDKSFTCLGSFYASAYSPYDYGLKCVGISPDLNHVLITVLPDAYLFDKNFNLVGKFKMPHIEGLSFEDRMGGEGHEWIYGVGFSSDSKFFYLGCHPGKTYKIDLEGNVVAVYAIPEDKKSQHGFTGNKVYSIIEIQDYLYIVSSYYIYILRDGQFVRTIQNQDRGYKWFEKGFIAISNSSAVLYDLDGIQVATFLFPDKVRYIAFSEGLFLIETSRKSYLFSTHCQDSRDYDQ